MVSCEHLTLAPFATVSCNSQCFRIKITKLYFPDPDPTERLLLAYSYSGNFYTLILKNNLTFFFFSRIHVPGTKNSFLTNRSIKNEIIFFPILLIYSAKLAQRGADFIVRIIFDPAPQALFRIQTDSHSAPLKFLDQQNNWLLVI